MPEVTEILPKIKQVLGNVIGFLLGKSGSGGLSWNEVNGALAPVFNAIQDAFNGIAHVHGNVVTAWAHVSGEIDDAAGAIEAIGRHQHELWHHLRWVLMPNTVQYVWDFTFRAWILPLRRHLGVTAFWCRGWFTVTVKVANDWFAWTHNIVAAQRAWRATYVYPQLQWLMNPGKVAYYYTQSFLTEIAQYLSFAEHVHDRDAITRVVWENAPNLWRYMEGAFVGFLLSDTSTAGVGSELPQRPADATEAPPDVPPQWEVWIDDPGLWTLTPTELPGIPEEDVNYDGGYVGV